VSGDRLLLVMRHAKSAWGAEGLSDHARPLNPRGQADAPRVGRALAQRGWLPEQVECSDAVRARQTWEAIASTLPIAPRVRFHRSLYLSGLEAVARLAPGWSEAHSQVMVVGHNPGWEQLVEALSGLSVKVTTGNVVALRGQGRSWPEALSGRWSLEGVIRPRELGSPDGA
jgi:phosphohistidine phosphatase